MGRIIINKSLILNELKSTKNIKTDAEFARFLGVAPNVLANWHKRNTFDDSKIVNAFPDVNEVWLLTGEGEMLKNTQQQSSMEVAHHKDYTMVPVYNFDAVGGMNAWNEVFDSPQYIERYVPFETARKEDICVHVTGNSMVPAYSSGSLLLVRRVEGWREYFGYGHVYVLLLRDGRRILKEVRKSELNPVTHVLCVSYNPQNEPEELPRDFIEDVYKVIYTLTNEGF